MNDALSKSYHELNKHLFDSQLPDVSFVPDISKKFVFRFQPESVVVVIGSGFSEIQNMNELLDELLHEMVHICNHERGVEDHTVNQYHKKEFCDLALRVGLYVIQTGNRGWGVTTSQLEQDFEGSYRKPEPEDEERRKQAYRVAKIHPITLSKHKQRFRQQVEARPSKQYQFKYVCGCPESRGNSIRCGRRPDGENALNATCNVCKKKFVYEGNLS